MRIDKEMLKRAKRFIRPMLIVLGAILVVLLGFGIWVYASISNMKDDTPVDAYTGEKLPEPEYALEDEEEEMDPSGLVEAAPTPIPLPTQVPDSEREIYNFVLFGLDTRDPDNLERGNTDVMLIITLDKEHGKIKITSLMRDMLVQSDVTPYPYARLNSIYSYGGAPAAVKTIQNITGIPIHGYAIMNFYTVAQTIDVLGGVTIDVNSSEVVAINRMLEGKFGNSRRNLKHSGTQLLDGERAVMYMRVRRVGNSDFGRTQRQRIVLG